MKYFVKMFVSLDTLDSHIQLYFWLLFHFFSPYLYSYITFDIWYHIPFTTPYKTGSTLHLFLSLSISNFPFRYFFGFPYLFIFLNWHLNSNNIIFDAALHLMALILCHISFLCFSFLTELHISRLSPRPRRLRPWTRDPCLRQAHKCGASSIFYCSKNVSCIFSSPLAESPKDWVIPKTQIALWFISGWLLRKLKFSYKISCNLRLQTHSIK